METLNKRTAVVLALFLITGLFVNLKDRRAQSMELAPEGKTLPRLIEDWEGVDLPYDARIFEGVLGADATTFREYVDSGSARAVQTYLAYYRSMERSDLAHAPEVCYVGQGWEIVKTGRETLKLGDGAGTVRASRMLIAKGDRRELVLYWYQVKDRTFTGIAGERMQLIFNRMLGKPDENLWEEALSTLSAFVSDVYPDTLALFAD
jgi:EpsI family protein